MLVLSRKVKDRIVFPELGISIEVKEIRGKQVRVGIEAPDDIKILRGELTARPSSSVPDFQMDLPGTDAATELATSHA